MKRLIRKGNVIDGTGHPSVRMDVLMEDGRIACIAPELADADAEQIDASGLIVAPGFVDMHRHCDIAPFDDPHFGELELRQGITSTASGNCGIACVPSSPESAQEYAAFVAPIIGDVKPEGLFRNYAAYAQALSGAQLPLNVGFLAGTGAVRVAVKGFSPTPYTAEQLSRAQALVREAMEQGSFGVSLGFMYQPECYTTREEQVQVILPAAQAGGVLTTHVRGEGNSLVQSVQEVIDIADRAGIRLHISHLKATGIRNWRGTIFRAIDAIEQARARGQQVTADFYPYAGGSTTIFSLIPPGVMKESNEKTLAYLATPEGKAALRAQISVEDPHWDNMALSIGWDRIVIAGTTLPEHASYSGCTVAQLAERQGYDDASDFICDLVVSEAGKVGIIVLSMDERDVDDVARLPYTAVISDALYGNSTNPHPRLYGTFPHLLRNFVLERGVLTLPQAIHKITALPASCLGLTDRGILRAGSAADLVIFDPKAICDHATYADSRQLSSGIARVIVSGKDAVIDDRVCVGNNGCFIRKSDSMKARTI